MSRSYACIVSPNAKEDKEALVSVAHQFAYSIEVLDDGILFDVSGLERLIGKRSLIARKVLEELQKHNVPGSVAVAETIETATLLARRNDGVSNVVHSPDTFQKLPLSDLPIERDTLNVFTDLGVRWVEDLIEIPREELIGRYGREFEEIIDIAEQKGSAVLTPNVKESETSWSYLLDSPVEDFEQLIFLLNHGLDDLFVRIAHIGLSTEQLDLSFELSNRTKRNYEIKTSFPTLERSFWLKLINLRVSLDPPEAGIKTVNVIAHFTKPRPSQTGLYAVSRPEPQSLLLTVNKLKKLVGEENVGVPVILDQRAAEAFALDAEAMPSGRESVESGPAKPIIAFSYFRPPIRAEVLVREGRLVFIRTRYFSGHVIEYSGVWRANSKWWENSWKTQEWDVEVEAQGVYRLCKADNEWFLIGEYD